jgi:Tfp pilus assembly protein PilO
VNVDRDLIAQLVIILAVCVGGWMMFVQPKAAELAELETRIEAASGAGANGGLSFEAVVKRMSEMRQELIDITEKNAMSERSSELYGLIKDLAAEHGVLIQRLQPGGEGRGSKSEAFRASRIQLTAVGRYANVAELLEAIGGLPGFVRPKSLNVKPVREATTPMVSVEFTCEVLRFEFDEVLASMGTKADAQP